MLIVGPGEVIPVDGRVADGVAVLDESVLTGEPLHVEHPAGELIRSGAVNAGGAFELRATASATDSTYAGIVRLAEQASAESAPIIRLADRLRDVVSPAHPADRAGAAWLVSGSAVRAVAVLVVATPCPLLLAAPVAIVSGLSRASRLGVVIRSGGALENLGHATTLVLDKTGTLTVGRPVVVETLTAPGYSAADVLRLAASVDQMSAHVLAEAIVAEALTRGLELSVPDNVTEEPGRGATATIDDRRVHVGKLDAEAVTAAWARAALNRARLDSAAIAWVVVDGDPVGAILLRDPLRRDAPRTIRRLRAAGLNRLVMLTGDRPDPAREVGAVLGLDAVFAHQSPADKVAAVRTERETATTIMVGDGVNDAPALAAATVGVAMGARGATASSEAADIVLTTNRLDRLADAMDIARWSRRIALQSAMAGDGPVAGGDGGRRGRLAAARLGGADPGGHRRRGDPQRAAGVGRRPGHRGRSADRHRENVAPVRLRARRAARRGRTAARGRRSARRRRSRRAGRADPRAHLPDRTVTAARSTPRRPSSIPRWPVPSVVVRRPRR